MDKGSRPLFLIEVSTYPLWAGQERGHSGGLGSYNQPGVAHSIMYLESLHVAKSCATGILPRALEMTDD